MYVGSRKNSWCFSSFHDSLY